MKEATVIYPHQLFAQHPALKKGRGVYLVEESLFITEFSTHVQKQLLHRLSLKAYQAELEAAGFAVTYVDVHNYPHTEKVFQKIADDGIAKIHIADSTDDWLERRIELYAHRYGLTRTNYESPLFMLTKADSIHRYTTSKKFMAAFYKKMRKDFGILMEDDGTPTGGAWSFDSENRQKLPSNITLPSDIAYIDNDDVRQALVWQSSLPGTHYGHTQVWVPYTRTDAHKFLTDFLHARFSQFGPYEDAIDTEHTRLFHSTLSPLLNIGLLTPSDVIKRTLAYAKKHAIPIASLEGFIRQVIGWREFIRASYEADGRTMRRQNFFTHTRKLPASYWDATTNLLPLDTAIQHALAFGYTHHIERLMVLGNSMLLSEIVPDDVYTWFMAMYVDAYDWVMVPNVYGMSQFADGGSFATKPYISGGSYLKKMSNYPKGPWEQTWTALYWHFIQCHEEVFLKNHRLAMMPRLFKKMDTAKQQAYLAQATAYLATLED